MTTSYIVGKCFGTPPVCVRVIQCNDPSLNSTVQCYKKQVFTSKYDMNYVNMTYVHDCQSLTHWLTYTVGSRRHQKNLPLSLFFWVHHKSMTHCAVPQKQEVFFVEIYSICVDYKTLWTDFENKYFVLKVHWSRN